MTQSAIHIPQRTVARERLSNGTTLLYSPNPYNSIAAIRIVSRLASRHEAAEKAGMANLCMRLLSSGTALHNEEEIADNLERNGAHFKAEASKDWCIIDLLTTTQCLREDLRTVMELLDTPTFPEDKLEREREVVRMNILEQEDSHLTYTMRIFRSKYYGGHSYGWPSIGLIETLDNPRRDDLAQFAQAALDPAQLIVSVVGGDEASDLLPIVRDSFAARASRLGTTAPETTKALPAIETNEEIIENRDTESEYIVVGYPGDGLCMPGSVPLRVISAILGGSMDSRLFREVRDKRGLCYQVGSAYTPLLDHSPLLLYVVTNPDNREKAIPCMEAEVEKLKTEAVSDEELNRVKTYINGTYVMSMETNMGQASRYAAYEAAGLGWEYANRLPEEINQVSAEDVMKAAQKYFTFRLLAITTPDREENDEE